MRLKTVIMAGGKGTRISSIASDIPKPMIDICGKPLLERQIECLKRQGITELTITVGHLGHKIQEYFQNGSKLGVKIDYIVEEEPLGTAGALYYLKDCKEENLLLINGDIIFDIDIEKFLGYHIAKNADVTLFTHPNNHPYDSALIKTNSEGRITGWMNKEDERTDYRNIVNAGIHILSTNMLKGVFGTDKAVKTDLDRDVLKPNIDRCNMYAYQSPEYVKDMGTPDRYHN
ncbi:MAG: nucleotidyltransferase family protein, partial [Acetivibrio ethanolgignens]